MRLHNAAAGVALAFGLSLAGQAQGFLTNRLVAYYPLNGNAVDARGQGNAGSLYNGAYYTNGPGGEASSAVGLDGVYAYVSFGKNDAVYPNQVLTWSLWFKPEAGPGILLFDDDWQDGGDRGLMVDDLGHLAAFAYRQRMSGASVVTPDAWHQAAFTSDASGRRLYLDGGLEAAESGIIEDHTGRSLLCVGAASYTQNAGPNNVYLIYPRFKGALARLRIYGRALSGQEVRDLYAYESQPRSWLTAEVKTVRVTLHVTPARKYQLLASLDLTAWTNLGEPFVATTSEVVEEFNALEVGRYFRLEAAP